MAAAKKAQDLPAQASLSPAERRDRAQRLLATQGQQLAEISAQLRALDDEDRQVDQVTGEVHRRLRAAEGAVNAAYKAHGAAGAALLTAQGTPDEAAAAAAVTGAAQDLSAARSGLEHAQAAVERSKGIVAREHAAVAERRAPLLQQRDQLQRTMDALRTHADDAHTEAGEQELAALQAEYAERVQHVADSRQAAQAAEQELEAFREQVHTRLQAWPDLHERDEAILMAANGLAHAEVVAYHLEAFGRALADYAGNIGAGHSLRLAMERLGHAVERVALPHSGQQWAPVARQGELLARGVREAVAAAATQPAQVRQTLDTVRNADPVRALAAQQEAARAEAARQAEFDRHSPSNVSIQ